MVLVEGIKRTRGRPKLIRVEVVRKDTSTSDFNNRYGPR